MAFHELPFHARFAQLGDQAEEAFVRYAEAEEIQFEKYGFNRPSLTRYRFMPPFLRSTPDFVAQADKALVLVECKGTKSDTVKIKAETLTQMEQWSQYMPLLFSIYNSRRKEVSFISFGTVQERIQFIEVKQFENDKKEYYEVPYQAGLHLRAALPAEKFGKAKSLTNKVEVAF